MNQTARNTAWPIAAVAMLVVGCLDSGGQSRDAGARDTGLSVDASCGCDPRTRAEMFAGPGAVDCSLFDVPGAARMCVTEAIAAHQPFVLVQDANGIDSIFLAWLVGDAEGHVFSGSSDSDPSGGSGACPTFSLGRCGAFEVFDSPPTEFNLVFTCHAQEPPTPLCDARN